ncbi:hypothetical protein CKA32_004528 [Geitlerinema sp. FC II]|nr:hypothetical protein CKA32_004528 [Geitlerinema sp. FC II]
MRLSESRSPRSRRLWQGRVRIRPCREYFFTLAVGQKAYFNFGLTKDAKYVLTAIGVFSSLKPLFTKTVAGWTYAIKPYPH